MIVFIVPQFILSQEDLFLTINSLNSTVLDFTFTWLTHLGDGLFFTFIIVVYLFSSYSRSLTGLIIFLTTSIFAQVLKRIFFSDSIRPYGELGSIHDLHIPNGVEPLSTYSFPSGHTVTAFAIATFFVLISKRKDLGAFILILAWLVGYSRIYLTHHYPVDVWVGSMIGTIGGLLLYWLVAIRLDNKFGNRSLLGR